MRKTPEGYELSAEPAHRRNQINQLARRGSPKRRELIELIAKYLATLCARKTGSVNPKRYGDLEWNKYWDEAAELLDLLLGPE